MPPLRPTLAHEARCWADGRLLVGVDEAGRGPLAGPVVAAAVVFPQGAEAVAGVRDSKTLPEPRRDTLAHLIRQHALAIGVAAASVREIDELNIRRATALAMRRAVARLLRRLDGAAAPRLLVDGHPVPELGYDHDALVDGDALCHTVASAGIIAKTVRDRLMVRLAARHGAYGWERNRGYGSAEHLAALRVAGPTVHHRRSFSPVSGLGLPIWPPRTACPRSQSPAARN